MLKRFTLTIQSVTCRTIGGLGLRAQVGLVPRPVETVVLIHTLTMTLPTLRLVHSLRDYHHPGCV